MGEECLLATPGLLVFDEIIDRTDAIDRTVGDLSIVTDEYNRGRYIWCRAGAVRQRRNKDSQQRCQKCLFVHSAAPKFDKIDNQSASPTPTPEAWAAAMSLLRSAAVIFLCLSKSKLTLRGRERRSD